MLDILPPETSYRCYTLKELTQVPRTIHRLVETWQPVFSTSPRGLNFMVKHGIKDAVGDGAATMRPGGSPRQPEHADGHTGGDHAGATSLGGPGRRASIQGTLAFRL